MFGNRWYDNDQKVSLAVGCIERAIPSERRRVAMFLIKKSQMMGIKIKENRIIFFRRWYDHDKELSTAMEYFKNAPEQAQRQLAASIIEMLTEQKNIIRM